MTDIYQIVSEPVTFNESIIAVNKPPPPCYAWTGVGNKYVSNHHLKDPRRICGSKRGPYLNWVDPSKACCKARIDLDETIYLTVNGK